MNRVTPEFRMRVNQRDGQSDMGSHVSSCIEKELEMRKIANLPDANTTEERVRTNQSNTIALLCEQICVKNDSDEMRYRNVVNSLGAPFIELFEHVFADDGFWNLFLNGPSSLNGHHSQAGGNLRHSIEVAETAARIAYGSMDLFDVDVLVAGALLHDVGKATEYRFKNKLWWELTEEGRMLGHKVTGSILVGNALSRVSGITHEQKLGLLNCLISSNYGYELRPQQCFEAECISRADQISASADLYRRSAFLQNNKPGLGQAHRHQSKSILHISTAVDMDTQKYVSRFATFCKKKN